MHIEVLEVPVWTPLNGSPVWVMREEFEETGLPDPQIRARLATPVQSE